jgi:hypothetical protein
MKALFLWLSSVSFLVAPIWFVCLLLFYRWGQKHDNQAAARPNGIRRLLARRTVVFFLLGILTAGLFAAFLHEMHRLAYVGEPQLRPTAIDIGGRAIVSGPRYFCVLKGELNPPSWVNRETRDIHPETDEVSVFDEPRCVIELSSMKLWREPPDRKELLALFGFAEAKVVASSGHDVNTATAYIGKNRQDGRKQWILLSVGRQYVVCACLDPSSDKADLSKDFMDRVERLQAW